jgi:hypothetical protein
MSRFERDAILGFTLNLAMVKQATLAVFSAESALLTLSGIPTTKTGYPGWDIPFPEKWAIPMPTLVWMEVWGVKDFFCCSTRLASRVRGNNRINRNNCADHCLVFCTRIRWY